MISSDAIPRTDTSWTGLFENNRTVSNGLTLSFIPPTIIEGENRGSPR